MKRDHKVSNKTYLKVSSWLVLLITGLFWQPCRSNAQWVQALDEYVYCAEFNPLSKGKILFAAGTSPGILRSDDGGRQWVRYTDGLGLTAGPDVRALLVLSRDTNVVLASSTRLGLLRSSDGGRSWRSVLPSVLGEGLAETDGGELLAAEEFSGIVYHSTDNGETWHEIGSPAEDIPICVLTAAPGPSATLLQGSEDGGIARSTDGGESWVTVVPGGVDPVTSFRPEIPEIRYSAQNPSAVIATRWLASTGELLQSLDDGVTWNPLFGPPRAWGLAIDQTAPLTNGASSHHWVGLFDISADTIPKGVVQETTDGAKTWRSTGHPPVEQVWELKYSSGTLASATNRGLYLLKTPGSVELLPASHYTITERDHAISIQADGHALTIEVIDILGRRLLERAIPTGAATTFDKPRCFAYLIISNHNHRSIRKLLP